MPQPPSPPSSLAGSDEVPLTAPSLRRPAAFSLLCPEPTRRPTAALGLACAFALGAAAALTAAAFAGGVKVGDGVGGAAASPALAWGDANATTTAVPAGWSCAGGAQCLNARQGPIKRYNYDVGAHKLTVGGVYLGKQAGTARGMGAGMGTLGGHDRARAARRPAPPPPPSRRHRQVVVMPQKLGGGECAAGPAACAGRPPPHSLRPNPGLTPHPRPPAAPHPQA